MFEFQSPTSSLTLPIRMTNRIRRNDPTVKGTIVFDSNSTIMTSSYKFHGLPKYDNCIIYIATPQKKEYFLYTETPGATRTWVATLHATQLVLRAHKGAVNSLAGNSSAKVGTVSAVVTAANSRALESSKEIEAAMPIARINALGSVLNKAPDGPLDDLTIMKAYHRDLLEHMPPPTLRRNRDSIPVSVSVRGNPVARNPVKKNPLQRGKGEMRSRSRRHSKNPSNKDNTVF